MSGFPVRVEGLRKSYGMGAAETHALDQVTFGLDRGSTTAVMGPSGSGKSTLLHLIGAMDRADEGSIMVDDTNVVGLSRAEQVSYRRRIGFVFQQFHLIPALTALENVVSPLLPRHTEFDKFERARTLLAAVRLEGKEQSVPSQLSGGEQQRVAIARALLNGPGLLLADEPTGNLDSQNGSQIMALLLQLRNQHGMTVIVATHDPAVAAQCDTTLRLRDGQLVGDEAASPKPAATSP